MTRSVIKPADWIIGPERDGDGHLLAPSRTMQCTACTASSEPSSQQAAIDRWAMRHTGVTGHREFDEITTARLRVSPAPTSPLADR